MATETELKLSIDPPQRTALARHPILVASTALGSRRLVSSYYDTPDLDLRLHGMALRLRRQGRQWLQTVKRAGTVSAGLTARPEWEAPYDGENFDFSVIDDEEVRRWLERGRIRKRLIPIFETTFTRRTWRHAPSPGKVVLIMLDSGTITSGGRSAPISELELELAEGSVGDLLDLAKALAEQIPVRPGFLSKGQRGYALFEQATITPVKAAPSPLTPTHDLAGGFRALAMECLNQVRANESGARESRDPEFVHQMRVALRRLRSVLRVFAPALAPEALERVAGEIAELATQLGAARDWDVLVEEVLGPVAKSFPGDQRVVGLADKAAERRAAAQTAARATIDNSDYGRLMLDLLAFFEAPSLTALPHEHTDLRGYLLARIDNLRRKLRKRADDAAELDVAALHRLRIAAKRLRYALEFAAPMLPRKIVRGYLKDIATLQSDLGFLNDIANAGRLLAECAGEDAAMREGLALVAGWHGPHNQEILARLPRDIRTLVSHTRF